MNNIEFTETYINNNQIVIDIETVPDIGVLDKLPEPNIDSRIKDPDKVIKALESARVSQVEKMALNPLTAKIACIGYYNETIQEVDIDSEKNMLDNAWDKIKSLKVISYNGLNFDIPFIFKRGIINGCDWATIPNMKQYTDKFKSASKHIDLMNEWCAYGQFEKLDNLASFLLNDKKVEFDYREIPQLLESEEGKQKLKEYCLQDCALTWKLAKKLGF